jgi:alpha-tubulin suppressor-like RCC1 family protein
VSPARPLETPTRFARSPPGESSGLESGVVSVSAGDDSACAITGSGAIVCWGENAHGQLGNNSYTRSSVPVPVVGFP